MTAPTERGAGTSTIILEAARRCLLEAGFARLSTRRIADEAGVPLSQIHYHFGSKQGLVLAVLEEDNARLLRRQEDLFTADLPLWKQWEQACDFLEDDLASGYVRVLQEMLAAGWSDPEVAHAVSGYLRGWYDLIADLAGRAADRLGGLGPFDATEVAALVGNAFLGAESMILLGVGEEDIPSRSALRKVGALIRTLEED